MKWKRQCPVSGGTDSEVLYLSDSSKILAQEPIRGSFGGGWFLFSFLRNICLSTEHQEVCLCDPLLP